MLIALKENTLKLYENIKVHQKPHGDGKGGTYFGATGCGKSFTMLYLTRMLMKSIHFSSPTIILITDSTDLEEIEAQVIVESFDQLEQDKLLERCQELIE